MFKSLRQYFKPTWLDVERYNVTWKVRIEQMSKMIPEDCETLIDMGAGHFWLREYLSPNISYTPLDLKKTSDLTIVYDLNQHQFPTIAVDCIFCSGLIEYLQDLNWFLEKCNSSTNHLLISYCTIEYHPNKTERRKNAWKNHLSKVQLIQLIGEHGFRLINQVDQENSLFLFSKK